MKSKYDEYGYDEYEEGLSVDSYSAAPAAPAAAAPAAAVSRRPSVDAQLRAPTSASAPVPASVPVEDSPPEIVDVDEEGNDYEYGGYYTSEDGAKQG